MNFIMSSFSEVQFWEKRIQSLLIQIEIFSSTYVFTLEFVGTTKAKCRNEYIFWKLNAHAFQRHIDDITYVDA